MGEQGQGEGRQRNPGDDLPPELLSSLRELLRASGATWGAAREALTALRILVQADISLARSAFGRTLALTGVAIAAGGTTWPVNKVGRSATRPLSPTCKPGYLIGAT